MKAFRVYVRENYKLTTVNEYASNVIDAIVKVHNRGYRVVKAVKIIRPTPNKVEKEIQV